ncbi:MAG TPA: DUF1552 domain-containing protein [Pyrinomonadaceae bacterium]|nr:DUF1552 domain-containing protein [Pyrinomonadaceae bacterium]
MIITRKRLPRRTFLRGMGTMVAIPMLDAMVPAFASSRDSELKAPARMAFAYVPNGIVMKEWTPKTTGSSYEFTRILKPLEAFRDDILVLSNLDSNTGNALGDGPGDHARAGASFLTGVHCRKTAGADIRGGVSVDQVAATKFTGATRFPSLELGCEDSRTVGDCDSGYSCAYTNSLSWRTPQTPMPPEVNPRAVFERLFGTAEDLSLDAETRARRFRYRKSILDLVTRDTQSLVKTLGPGDRRKLDEYLFSVRQVEQRIESVEKDPRRPAPGIDKPSGIPFEFPQYVKLMCDLQVLAFQSDLTRVVTLVIGREGSNRVYPEIGIDDPHHPLTHHRNNPEWIEKVTRINTLHTEMFAYLLKRLKSTPEGDGTLLDHSLLLYGSGLADGNAHTHEALPVLLAGRGGGVKPGKHEIAKQGTPITNLYLSMLDRMGVHQDSLGDSSGMFEL